MSTLSVPPPSCLRKPLVVPQRHMFGPGPSNVPPRILEAGAKPVIGHMHPEIFEVIQPVGQTISTLCEMMINKIPLLLETQSFIWNFQ